LRAEGAAASPEATGNVMVLTWLALLACISLLVFLLFYRASPRDPGSLSRLALLHGVQRMRGESEESLRHRSTAASRWPYSHPDAGPSGPWSVEPTGRSLYARLERDAGRSLHRASRPAQPGCRRPLVRGRGCSVAAVEMPLPGSALGPAFLRRSRARGVSVAQA